MNFLDNLLTHLIDENSKTAIWTEHGSISYKELRKKISGIHLQLEQASVKAGDPIAILVGDHFDVYAGLLATLLKGCFYIPISKKFPLDRKIDILEQCGAKILLARNQAEEPIFFEKFNRSVSNGKIIYTENLFSEKTIFQPTIQNNSIAYILFTSGSTGKPKGVPIYHRNLNSFLETILTDSDYSFSKEDRFLQMFDLTFDVSIMSYLAPLCLGSTVYVPSHSEMGYVSVMSVLEEQKITVALMVPSLLTYCEPYFNEIHLPDLRISLFAGEALFERMMQLFSKSAPNAKIFNVYGPTEATIFCTKYQWTHQSYQEAVNGGVPIGLAMKKMNAYLLNEDNQLTKDDEQGELYLAGDQVTDHYWKNPEKTKEHFIEISINGSKVKAYRTGDICVRHANGNIVFCGRVDDQVKINGYRIELSEIDFNLKEALDTSAAVTITSEDSQSRKVICAFIETTFNQEELEKKLREKLPPYMIPKFYFHIKKFPLTTSGKVDKKILKNIAAEKLMPNSSKS